MYISTTMNIKFLRWKNMRRASHIHPPNDRIMAGG
jgi:hypothetical protein